MDKVKVYTIICHWRDSDGMDEVGTSVHSTLAGAQAHLAQMTTDEINWWRTELSWKIPDSALDGAAHYFKETDNGLVEVDNAWGSDLWVECGVESLHLYDTGSYTDTEFYISEQELGD